MRLNRILIGLLLLAILSHWDDFDTLLRIFTVRRREGDTIVPGRPLMEVIGDAQI